MSKKNEVLKRVGARRNEWSARGGSCPLCHKEFRHGCNHTVSQAYERLEQNVVNAMIDTKLKKALKSI